METDNIDIRFLDVLGRKEGLDRFGVDPRHERVGFRQHARPLPAVRQRHAIRQRLPQERRVLDSE